MQFVDPALVEGPFVVDPGYVQQHVETQSQLIDVFPKVCARAWIRQVARGVSNRHTIQALHARCEGPQALIRKIGQKQIPTARGAFRGQCLA
jgi:hypothetical protein